MKFNAMLASAILATSAAAQGGLDALAECGRTCVNNMLALAPSLGCNDATAECLCRNADFSYGIRDCSYQYCSSTDDAAKVVQYGIAYCQQAGVVVTATGPATISVPTGTLTVPSPGSPTGNGDGGAGGMATTLVSTLVTVITTDGSTITSTLGETTIVVGGGAGGSGDATMTPSDEASGDATAIATSTFETVVTESGTTFTTSVVTTISGVGGIPGATGVPATAVTTEPLVTTIVTDGSTITSTTGSTTIFSTLTGTDATNALSSQASEASTRTGTVASTTTPPGFAPKMTAAPAGLLAAMGFAALLL